MPQMTDKKEKKHKVYIRMATETDIDAFRQMRLEALQLYPESFNSSYDDEVKQPKKYWINRSGTHSSECVLFVALRNERYIGMCGAYKGANKKVRHCVYLWGLYVRHEGLGLQLGTKLISACVDWGRREGAVIAKCTAITTNVSAIYSCFASGFLSYGIEPASSIVNGIQHDDILFAQIL